ncbi:hypothetical protein BDZ85DRAFT_253275 [Elsinoe ampelina]|uniref:F-box domain-containing protein n=1 Tax=Elsinoe ampelina TaxID=302913 RepID=A0A6A6FZ95_9PEZI|nr:hypothetical protein BDZ85DRAFT_253275 [Elsinoe ampelina]
MCPNSRATTGSNVGPDHIQSQPSRNCASDQVVHKVTTRSTVNSASLEIQVLEPEEDGKPIASGQIQKRTIVVSTKHPVLIQPTVLRGGAYDGRLALVFDPLPTSTSRLMDLPAEVRAMIFTALLDSHDYTIFFHAPKTKLRLPAILDVSRQVRHEALPHLLAGTLSKFPQDLHGSAFLRPLRPPPALRATYLRRGLSCLPRDGQVHEDGGTPSKSPDSGGGSVLYLACFGEVVQRVVPRARPGQGSRFSGNPSRRD